MVYLRDRYSVHRQTENSYQMQVSYVVLIAELYLQHPSLNVWMAMCVCVWHVGVDYVVCLGMYGYVQCVYVCMHSSVNAHCVHCNCSHNRAWMRVWVCVWAFLVVWL